MTHAPESSEGLLTVDVAEGDYLLPQRLVEAERQITRETTIVVLNLGQQCQIQDISASAFLGKLIAFQTRARRINSDIKISLSNVHEYTLQKLRTGKLIESEQSVFTIQETVKESDQKSEPDES